tara:strand:- start:564 stop:995 length:432 start_codon:yes stop_codon:yes gene_type:complete
MEFGSQGVNMIFDYKIKNIISGRILALFCSFVLSFVYFVGNFSWDIARIANVLVGVYTLGAVNLHEFWPDRGAPYQFYFVYLAFLIIGFQLLLIPRDLKILGFEYERYKVAHILSKWFAILFLLQPILFVVGIWTLLIVMMYR